MTLQMPVARAVDAELRRECELTVVIPARNEGALIARTLGSFAAQRRVTGEPFPRTAFEIVVYCNDCDDGTAAIARGVARELGLRVHVLEATLPPGAAHVGTARRAGLDFAVDRYVAAGRPLGVVATTDADTIVAPCWIATILEEMRTVDAVAGFVTLAEADRAAMPAASRRRYELDLAYRRVLGRVEAALDPRPYDPWPRHDSFNGASFAVSAAAYALVGGLPALARLEDQAFSDALERGERRIRHSYGVYAATSARRDGRAAGGFASFLAGLDGPNLGDGHDVRSARATLEDARARALLRRALDGGRPAAASLAELAALVAIARPALDGVLARTCGFGEAWAELQRLACQASYAPEPVAAVVGELAAALRG